MKLVRTTSGSAFAACAGLAAMSFVSLFAGGCSATASAPVRTASARSTTSSATGAEVGTANLMSAELSGPAPRVGKAHLALDESDSDADATNSDADENAPPKEARRSDGSHRSGSFGTFAK